MHRVLQSLFLFAIVVGSLKQLPRPEHNRLFCFGNALGLFAVTNLRDCSFVKRSPISAVWRLANTSTHNGPPPFGIVRSERERKDREGGVNRLLVRKS